MTAPVTVATSKSVAGESVLQVSGLRVTYDAIEAVRGVSFAVPRGGVVTLIGANGAGKTTTLQTISGLHRPAGGTIWFEGERIDGLPGHLVLRRGIAHCPEGRRVFASMTVEDNLDLGAHTRRDPEVRADIDMMYGLFPVLGERRRQAAGTLSGGEQQMLAIGRALMSRPRLLMLDEPSMGLSPIMMQRIFTTLADLRAAGTTILLVEQNARAALALSDYGYVIETGRVTLHGPGDRLLGDERVRKAYLGED